MAFPTTGVIDSFTRADSGDLGANWSEDPFNEGAVSPAIASNAVINTAATSYNLAWLNTGTFGPDSEAYLTITTSPSSGAYRAAFLILRVQQPSTSSSTGDGYMAEWVKDGTVNIYAYANGAAGAVIANATGVTMSNGDVFGFEAIGTTLKVYKNGSAVLTKVDSTYTGAGYIGFGVYDQAVKVGVWDNFGGGTVVVAGAATHRRRRAMTGVGR